MSLQITGKNIDVGDAFRVFVTERIAQVTDKYLGRDVTSHVRVSKERSGFVTHCSMRLPTGLDVVTQGDGSDAYASATEAFERLEKRLRRHKRRLKDHHNGRPGDRDAMAMDYVVQPEESGQDSGDGDAPVIVAETKTVIREMSVSDAVMALDLSEQPLMLFRSTRGGRLNVVYRRPDGNIGWIDPAD